MITATALAVTIALTGATNTQENEWAATQDPAATPTAPTTDSSDSPTSPESEPAGPTSEPVSDETSQPTEPVDAVTSQPNPDVTPTTDVTPVFTPVEGWWAMPNGGTPENVTWDQPVANPAALTCGTWYQVDTYPSQAALDGLSADGVLELGEDYGVVISWRFVFGGDCPIITPETPVIVPDVPEVPTGRDTTPDLPVPDTGIDVPVYVEAPTPVIPTSVATAQPAPVPQAAVLASTGGTTNGWIPATGALLLGAALTISARIRKARA